MPSTPPSASNGYLISFDTKLNPATFNAVLGSVHERLQAQEAQVADYQAAIDQLTEAGLSMIAENVGPQLEAARQQLVDLEVFANQLSDDVGSIRDQALQQITDLATQIDNTLANAEQAIQAAIGLLGERDQPNGFAGVGEDGKIPASLLPVLKDFARFARTSNVVIGAQNIGQFIDITAGTFNQTFAPIADLPDGWFCYLRNSGKVFEPVDVNGTFSTDAGWTKGAGWSITGGKAVASAASQTLAANPAPLAAGSKYRISFDVDGYSSGGVRVVYGGNVSGYCRSNGRIEIEVTPSTSALSFATTGPFTGNIGNLVVEKIVPAEVTLDPAGSETIDGLTSYIMYPGEMRLIYKDGAQLRSVIMTPFSTVFPSSATFVKPPGYDRFDGEMWSGGGSGASGNPSGSYYSASGGGGSAFDIFSIDADAMPSTLPVIVGAGGASVVASIGQPGGATSFAINGLYVGVSPGQGGTINIGSTSTGGLGGDNPALASSSRYKGGAGGAGNTSSPAGNGATGTNGGGGGGGGGGNTTGATAGKSLLAGDGGRGNSFISPLELELQGKAPGGGGGGSACPNTNTPVASGAGGRGEFRIWGII